METNVQTVTEEVVNDGIQVEVSGTPKTEEIARESGWKPLEEWDGNPEEWVDAKTFNQRGEYLERIKAQSSQLKKLEKKLHSQEQTLKELADHHRKVAENERKKTLDELKDLKKQALDIGDNSRVVEIDDRIADLKATKVEAPEEQPQQQQGVHPDIVEWVEDNPWYNKDAILRGAVTAIVEEIVADNPELKKDVNKVLEMATNRLKEEFPSKFGKRRQAVTESTSSESTKGSPKNLARKLTEEQRQFAKRFIQQGALKSYEEYAQQLAEIGELQ